MSIIKLMRQIAHRLPIRNQLRDALAICKRLAYSRSVRQYARQQDHHMMVQPRILIVMNGGIGNVIEATALVQAVRMLLPRAHITIFVPPGGLFDNWCVVDRIVSAASEFDNAVFDMTIESYATKEWLVKADDQERFGEWHSPPYAGGHFLKPEREYNTDIARKLGYKGESPPLYVSVKKPEYELPDAQIRFVLAPGGKPAVKWRHKRWPYYTELAVLLLMDYTEAHLHIVGTDQDQFVSPEAGHPRLSDNRGEFSLSETAWLMQHSTLSIGNDCGPMHIADAVQAKALVIFGSTCEIKNGPLYKAVTISSDVDCRPCQYDEKLLLECNDPICLNRISVETVMERIRGMMRISGHGCP